MTLEEVTAIRDLLVENNFKELKPAEDMELISENYLTTKEIARKLNVKLDTKTTNEALTAFGYKQYLEGTSVPTNPENSAFMIKAIENEDTGEKDYYIQNVWENSIVEELNECMEQNEEFKKQKEEVIKRNKKIKNEKLRFFSRDSSFVALSIKKTGFSLKKDFIISLGFAIVTNNKIIKLPQNNIKDAIKKYEKFEFENICCIYPCNPLLKVEDIKKCLKLLEKTKKKFIFPVCEYSHPPEAAFYLKGRKKKIEFINKRNANKTTQSFKKNYHETIIYFYSICTSKKPRCG